MLGYNLCSSVRADDAHVYIKTQSVEAIAEDLADSSSVVPDIFLWHLGCCGVRLLCQMLFLAMMLSSQ